jgi:Anaphase-promoting complex subunit 4 WD40 domain
MTTTSNCFTSIQTVSVPSTRCLLCPSMDLIVLASDRLLVQRTVSWQRVAASDKDCSALCWSPDGTLLALGLKEGGYVIYDLELGMTDEEENCVHQQLEKPQVESLVWAHIGRPHKGWILTDEEKEREMEWRYVHARAKS